MGGREGHREIHNCYDPDLLLVMRSIWSGNVFSLSRAVHCRLMPVTADTGSVGVASTLVKSWTARAGRAHKLFSQDNKDFCVSDISESTV